MIDSMILGIFAGMFSCFIALLLSRKWAQNRHDADLDGFMSVAKMSMYLLSTLLICVGAATNSVIGSLAVSVYTLFGLFAFVVADEMVNSALFARLVGETE